MALKGLRISSRIVYTLIFFQFVATAVILYGAFAGVPGYKPWYMAFYSSCCDVHMGSLSLVVILHVPIMMLSWGRVKRFRRELESTMIALGVEDLEGAEYGELVKKAFQHKRSRVRETRVTAVLVNIAIAAITVISFSNLRSSCMDEVKKTCKSDYDDFYHSVQITLIASAVLVLIEVLVHIVDMYLCCYPIPSGIPYAVKTKA